MTGQSIPKRIPLLKISGTVEPDIQAKDFPQGLTCVSEVETSIPQGLPGQCYALEIPNIVKDFKEPGTLLGIFGIGKDGAALNDIYALGLAGRHPLVCKVIKNDAPSGSSGKGESSQGIASSRMKNLRKSFMTPTPLHIPDSQVSPIPDSAHEMIYLKSLNENETLKVVPLQEVVWMHPLIAVTQKPQE